MPAAALVLQDDTAPLDNADSYVSAAEIVLHFENLGDTTFTNVEEEIIFAKAREATTFFDIVWGPRAKGDATDEEQSTIYPRDGLPFPRKLKACIFELAKIAMAGPLGGHGVVAVAPDASRIAEMKAGSVEIKFAQAKKSALEQSIKDRFFLVDQLANTFLKSGALNTGSAR